MTINSNSFKDYPKKNLYFFHDFFKPYFFQAINTNFLKDVTTTVRAKKNRFQNVIFKENFNNMYTFLKSDFLRNIRARFTDFGDLAVSIYLIFYRRYSVFFKFLKFFLGNKNIDKRNNFSNFFPRIFKCFFQELQNNRSRFLKIFVKGPGFLSFFFKGFHTN